MPTNPLAKAVCGLHSGSFILRKVFEGYRKFFKKVSHTCYGYFYKNTHKPGKNF